MLLSIVRKLKFIIVKFIYQNMNYIAYFIIVSIEPYQSKSKR